RGRRSRSACSRARRASTEPDSPKAAAPDQIPHRNDAATLPGVGDEQKISWQELLASSRRDFDAGTDFTVAVEEEFALVDPHTLELTDRFEEIYAAALETDLAPNIVGELIASEVEVRTGRCDSFGE